MSDTASKPDPKSYRARLADRGLSRFEVTGREGDRQLIRTIAKGLAADDPSLAHLRTLANPSGAQDQAAIGGVLASLRRSPFAGSGVVVTRERGSGRKLDL